MREVHVVAALVPQPGDTSRFLVQQRAPGGSRGLLWEFPGGKVEAGESPESALVRECHEELGVRLEVGAKLWETVHRYPDLVVHLAIYRATLAEGEPRNLGAHDLRYASVSEMAGLPFCEADIPFIQLLTSGALAL